MNDKLILDVGMHKGEDTGFYLNRGYCVVAVDADDRLLEKAREHFASAVASGQLRLVPCAVSDREGEAKFHLSKESVWSSLRADVAGRRGNYSTAVRVQVRTLAGLMREYGVPYYCKIDVEGADAACLVSLKGTADLPRYISVEAECPGESERLNEERSLECLDRLHELGYRQFKLVEQCSLAVLSARSGIFRAAAPLWRRGLRRLGIRAPGFHDFATFAEQSRRRLSSLHSYPFPEGSSGPFGPDLTGEWVNYQVARSMYPVLRRDFMAMNPAAYQGLWADWHATQ